MSLTYRRTLQVFWGFLSVAVISACGALGSPGALPGANSAPQTSSRTFHFTHEPQRFKVPSGVTELTVTAYGARGGGYLKELNGNPGGLGAKVKATIPVTPGQVLIVNVGGRGIQNKHGAGGGGYNGGGASAGDAFGGGGSSDVRTAKDGLTDRLVVAGGGGGSGEDGSLYSCGGSSCSGSGSELLFGGTGGVGGAMNGGDGGAGRGRGRYGTGGGGGAGGSQSQGGAGGAGAGGSSGSFSSYSTCAAVDGSKGALFNGGEGASDGCGPGGGGGGGGYYGGGGGGGGGYDDSVATGSFYYESGGGGGGGGGTSFVEKSAIDVHETSGGASARNGEVVIGW
jgi:hypothetical protein